MGSSRTYVVLAIADLALARRTRCAENHGSSIGDVYSPMKLRNIRIRSAWLCVISARGVKSDWLGSEDSPYAIAT